MICRYALRHSLPQHIPGGHSQTDMPNGGNTKSVVVVVVVVTVAAQNLVSNRNGLLFLQRLGGRSDETITPFQSSKRVRINLKLSESAMLVRSVGWVEVRLKNIGVARRSRKDGRAKEHIFARKRNEIENLQAGKVLPSARRSIWAGVAVSTSTEPLARGLLARIGMLLLVGSTHQAAW